MRPWVLNRPFRALLVPLLAVAGLVGASPTHAAAAPGVPAVTLSPDTLNLGDVPVGSGSPLTTIKLTSTGTAPASGLWSSGATGGDVAIFAKDQYDPIQPGTSRSYYVTAEPMTVGPVDATLTWEYGDATQRRFVSFHVTYNGVVPPKLPYRHFELGLNGDLSLQMLYENFTLRPIGGTVAPFTFQIHSGSLTASNKGVLSSYGGLELKRWRQRAWLKIGLDLDRGHLTAVVTKGGPRVDIADVPPLGEGYDLLGNRELSSYVYLNAIGASTLNDAGLRPAAQPGDRFGYVIVPE